MATMIAARIWNGRSCQTKKITLQLVAWTCDMGFKYVIGQIGIPSTAKYAHVVLEHMEEDDDASKTIPQWVFLEYSVRIRRLCFMC